MEANGLQLLIAATHCSYSVVATLNFINSNSPAKNFSLRANMLLTSKPAISHTSVRSALGRVSQRMASRAAWKITTIQGSGSLAGLAEDSRLFLILSRLGRIVKISTFRKLLIEDV